MKSSAGLVEGEIKPESSSWRALVGGVPPALQAGGGASCTPVGGNHDKYFLSGKWK